MANIHQQTLYSWLQAADLADYHDQLVDRGVTEANFPQLAIHDFATLGIQNPAHRQRFFKLIQTVKRELASSRISPPRVFAGRTTPKSSSPDAFEVHSVDEEEGSPPSTSPVKLSSKKTPRDKAKIRVVVRKRPLNKREIAREETDVVVALQDVYTVNVHEPKTKVDLTKYIERHEFIFDDVFDESVSNAELYEQTAKPLVEAVFQGAKATCFAYGQTGSGKTHTMMGPEALQHSDGDAIEQEQGLYAMAARDLFAQLNDRAHDNLCVFVSFFEIYGGKLFDLLNERRKLVAREDRHQAVCIVGLQERECASVSSLLQMIQHGSQLRSTGVTGANIDSSRSHAILQISLCHKGISRKRVGRLSFIDLAGSERGVDTVNQDRRTRIEGAEINKSLLALKECIRAQDQHHKHTPFRGSKLTQVLKDSFIGNCRTIMVANISPNSGSCEHTLNTLRYADRVKELKKLGKTQPSRDAYMPHRVSTPAIVLPPSKQQPQAPTMAAIEQHESLISSIMEQEENIIEGHRKQVDDTMKIIREEMDLIKRFDDLSCGVEQYVATLEGLLTRKFDAVSSLRSQLTGFQKDLRSEEEMSSFIHK
uniref:Kinesin-like protein n=1 Tax=Spongospora subterranea TaxID=70186 RepID=A0A0H5QX09_9EUKA|eukprot:CRZ06470.1 hypothetical protein [Spongospora subterranea]